MSGVSVDPEFLSRFEAGLDLRSPAASVIPARVLGHGEITTVLDISRPTAGATTAVACKRMPMFRSDAEAAAYDTLYHEYEQILREEVGVDVVESRLVWLGWDPDAGAGRVDAAPGRPLADAPAPSARSSAADPAPSPLGRAGAVRTIVLYIVQELLPAASIGHVRVRASTEPEALALLGAALREMGKVFAFNEANKGRLELGFDGQISNWAFRQEAGSDGSPAARGPAREPGREPGDLSEAALVPRPCYFDTSTPLLRRDGVEQLEPELFLRSAPSFLVWIIRRFMLADVMERYYDRRKVAVDLVANLYKEQRPDLVPGAVRLVNEFFGACPEAPRVVPAKGAAPGAGDAREGSGADAAVPPAAAEATCAAAVDAAADAAKLRPNAAEPGPIAVGTASVDSPPHEPVPFRPITEEEVRAYYREDARIWQVYLAFRKVDRFIHRLLRKEYPYMLPGRVTR